MSEIKPTRLNSEYAFDEAAIGCDYWRIYPTVEPDSFREDKSAGSVILDGGAMWELVKVWIEGFCPLCGKYVEAGEVVCNDCFEQAKKYREER